MPRIPIFVHHRAFSSRAGFGGCGMSPESGGRSKMARQNIIITSSMLNRGMGSNGARPAECALILNRRMNMQLAAHACCAMEEGTGCGIAIAGRSTVLATQNLAMALIGNELTKK